MLKNIVNFNLFKVVVSTAIVALIAVFFGDSIKELKGTSLQIVILAVAVILVNFVLVVYSYLRDPLPSEPAKKKEDAKPSVKSVVDNETNTQTSITPDQSQDPTNVPVREMKSSDYSYSDEISLKRRDIIHIFGGTERRIKQEIASLNKRANINLIIGGIIAVFGIGTLVAFLLTAQEVKQGDGIALLIVHWVARLSLVSLVELFAFFFLKIYKTELLSIQYYQDELTSIESRKIALLFSIIHNNQDDISKSIECLVNIDRNFKMDVGQTTVDLEKLKTENSFIRSQMDNMLDIFKGTLSFRMKDKADAAD